MRVSLCAVLRTAVRNAKRGGQRSLSGTLCIGTSSPHRDTGLGQATPYEPSSRRSIRTPYGALRRKLEAESNSIGEDRLGTLGPNWRTEKAYAAKVSWPRESKASMAGGGGGGNSRAHLGGRDLGAKRIDEMKRANAIATAGVVVNRSGRLLRPFISFPTLRFSCPRGTTPTTNHLLSSPRAQLAMGHRCANFAYFQPEYPHSDSYRRRELTKTILSMNWRLPGPCRQQDGTVKRERVIWEKSIDDNSKNRSTRAAYARGGWENLNYQKGRVHEFRISGVAALASFVVATHPSLFSILGIPPHQFFAADGNKRKTTELARYGRSDSILRSRQSGFVDDDEPPTRLLLFPGGLAYRVSRGIFHAVHAYLTDALSPFFTTLFRPPSRLTSYNSLFQMAPPLAAYPGKRARLKIEKHNGHLMQAQGFGGSFQPKLLNQQMQTGGE
ncbi:hypothetical protein CCUS01_14786 [Colletotrichum cuscutae]|uniref:Uncharacterized protein n=1 Tax=Colletotrichum cuscutae TaxID=1209917 RepID=A0AAI9VHK6_9PEZI|nr:hypothetical protein CCUS01_14786 [Colletotrichum cuscutae]